MAPFPPALHRAAREHPLITLGVVTGVLLAALLALPFVSRSHAHRAHVATTANSSG